MSSASKPLESPLGLILLRTAPQQNLRSLPRARALKLMTQVLRGMIDHAQPPEALAEQLAPALDWLVALYDVQGPPSVLLRELLLVWIAAQNPALSSERPLFAPDALEPHLQAFPEILPETMLEALRAPARASPYSMEGQLEFLLERCGELDHKAGLALLRARDHLREARVREDPRSQAPQAPSFADLGATPKDATPKDSPWMSNVVMIAKQTFVWLDQLTQSYGRTITRLDQIPDAELDQMKGAGFTALWLIGLWERSKASRRIKHIMGKQDAVASAYALHDYHIAESLGGEAAFEDLKMRALQRGIRLAADMVPNHMGIDGRWLIEHPERFVQLDHPPFEGYRFSGPDLCCDDNITIQLEDGYYDGSDAAVVFKRTDRRTDEARYIYHGNDGMQLPWNDTAQLDYLNPEVRESIIQTIVEIAQRFPIIRIDAAMTLARKHVRRLWHPAPGEGGAIPSRATYGESPEVFNDALPAEFWRQVVDRLQKEAPDTLLLAEAFWMMEGYFVRTLGVHRVYNSAFMHLLRDERTAEYRKMLRELVSNAPSVLERFVNFLNNPDEETALTQFGDGDRYFGVATVMVTMPGLPLFGHGQVQGLREKYGMEFQRPHTEENSDEALIARHRREIFPLMRRRHLFSGVKHFKLYDLIDQNSQVNQDVLAYSNRKERERALVVYNNTQTPCGGWVRGAPNDLLDLLSLQDGDYVGLKENRGGHWYLRSAQELRAHGLFVTLPGYCCQVFLEFQPLEDPQGRWAALERSLGRRGVPDLEGALEALEAQAPESGFLEFSTNSEKNRGSLIPHVRPNP